MVDIDPQWPTTSKPRPKPWASKSSSDGVVLDKPRHAGLIAEIRQAGARIQLHTDGDVAGALMAVDPTLRPLI